MRDLIITLIVFGSVPIILKRPHVGLYMWFWISLMNPHRLSWGFAYSMPFAAIIGGATLVSFVLHPEERRPIPWNGVSITLLILVIWTCITTLAATNPELSNPLWAKFTKIQLFNFITLALIFGKERIMHLMWISVFSLAFFGTKGGVYTIMTGGSNRVIGPPDSAISDNNHVALAFVVIIPLMMFLRSQVSKKWFRHAILLSVILTALSVVGSYSRGAFLAGFSMVTLLWMRSSKKLPGLIAMLIIIPSLIAFMPDKYMAKMNTIDDYDTDTSAQGRFNAWFMAIGLANARPITGGGFHSFTAPNFLLYAPEPEDPHAAHSIYFQMLGDHGYVGLFLFLLLGFLCLSTTQWIRKNTRPHEDLKWAGDLATALQVSLVGFSIGGAFLSLANWDFYYELAAIIAILKFHVQFELNKPDSARPAANQGSATPKAIPHKGARGWYAKPPIPPEPASPESPSRPNTPPNTRPKPLLETKFSNRHPQSGSPDNANGKNPGKVTARPGRSPSSSTPEKKP